MLILNLEDFSEELLPNEKQTDTQPVWLGEKIYFLSDRDWVTNIWSYTPSTKQLEQLATFTGADVKSLSGKDGKLVFEREGFLNIFDLSTQKITQLDITITGDFPWAETKWEDVSGSARNVSLSPTFFLNNEKAFHH